MTATTPVWRTNWAVVNNLDGPMDIHTPESHTGDDNLTVSIQSIEI